MSTIETSLLLHALDQGSRGPRTIFLCFAEVVRGADFENHCIRLTLTKFALFIQGIFTVDCMAKQTPGVNPIRLNKSYFR